MLVDSVDAVHGAGGVDLSIEQHPIPEGVDHLQQHRRIGRRVQHEVELAIHLAPRLRLTFERHHRHPPIQVGGFLEMTRFKVRSGEAKRKLLQAFSDPIDLRDLRKRKLGDKRTTARKDLHEALGFELTQALPDGNDADPEAFGEHLLIQPRTEIERPVENPRSDLIAHVITGRLRWTAFVLAAAPIRRRA